jgi:hypothetical protein
MGWGLIAFVLAQTLMYNDARVSLLMEGGALNCDIQFFMNAKSANDIELVALKLAAEARRLIFRLPQRSQFLVHLIFFCPVCFLLFCLRSFSLIFSRVDARLVWLISLAIIISRTHGRTRGSSYLSLSGLNLLLALAI